MMIEPAKVQELSRIHMENVERAVRLQATLLEACQQYTKEPGYYYEQLQGLGTALLGLSSVAQGTGLRLNCVI